LVGTAKLVARLYYSGDHARAEPLLAWLETAVAAAGVTPERDPSVAAYLYAARAERAMWSADAEQQIVLLEKAVAAFEAAGDRRNACCHRPRIGNALSRRGMPADAAAHLRP